MPDYGYTETKYLSTSNPQYNPNYSESFVPPSNYSLGGGYGSQKAYAGNYTSPVPNNYAYGSQQGQQFGCLQEADEIIEEIIYQPQTQIVEEIFEGFFFFDFIFF